MGSRSVEPRPSLRYMRALIFAVMLSFISLGCVIWSPPTHAQLSDPCLLNDVYSCAGKVRDELLKRPDNYRAHADAAFELAVQWDRAYRVAYLRVKGQRRTTSDVDKILEELRSKVDPIEWAKDKLVDAAVKNYLPRLAPLVDFLASAPATALTVFLTPSQTASDFDELESLNKDVQTLLFSLTSNALRDDWKMRYTTLIQQIPLSPKPSAPEIRLP